LKEIAKAYKVSFHSELLDGAQPDSSPELSAGNWSPEGQQHGVAGNVGNKVEKLPLPPPTMAPSWSIGSPASEPGHQANHQQAPEFPSIPGPSSSSAGLYSAPKSSGSNASLGPDFDELEKRFEALKRKK
jgi:hypothetical protein